MTTIDLSLESPYWTKDNKGQMIETVYFDNGLCESMYSVDLHKINIYCNNYGLDATDFNIFYEVKDLLKL